MSIFFRGFSKVLAGKDEIDTLIFDEIDTGISGRTAQKVSEKMQTISKAHQIICITHLPQIAAKADTHLKVYKKVEDDRTLSQMIILNDSDRVEEIAKMLSSDRVTDSALATARELMNG